jgi:hypothetical protein
MVHSGSIGSCCKDLADAMSVPEHSMFRVEADNKVLYFTIGYIDTEKGPGWFDQAVIYCPFCGKQLQTKEDIARKSNAS